MYVNSVLATLNARSHLRSIGQPGDYSSRDTNFTSTRNQLDTPHGSQTPSNIRFHPQQSVSVVLHDDDHPSPGIKVDTETYIMSDIDQKRGERV